MRRIQRKNISAKTAFITVIFILVITAVVFAFELNINKSDIQNLPNLETNDNPPFNQNETSGDINGEIPDETPDEIPADQTPDDSIINPSEEIIIPDVPNTGFTPEDDEIPEEGADTPDIDKNAWNLVIANVQNPLPGDFTTETEVVQGKYEMDSRCAEDARRMISDAAEDNISLLLCSAYRSIDTQERLYNNKVQEYIDLGKSESEAAEVASTIVAIPGTSEHQTGLAADIVTPSYQRLNADFDQTDAFLWLYENCYKYGFILRYPKDKQDITKIIYEPWHYRYVGIEHAEKIMQQGLCLEEYLNN